MPRRPALGRPAGPLFAAALLLAAVPAARADLQFELNGLTGTDANSVNARAGFQRAARLWSDIFTDDITIRLDVDFRNLGSQTLGQAGSATQNFSLTQVQAALTADATGTRDIRAAAAAVALGPTLEFRTGRSGSFTIDGNANGSNTGLRVNRANARALGLIAGDAAGSDASITFNSSVGFDFDQSDGIGAGLIDFVGVAAHEIGHAMGFVSGNGFLFNNSPGVLDNFPHLSTLDLFRYSADSLAAVGSDGIDISTDFNPYPYFSIDGGLTVFQDGQFETGSNNGGSGNQGSHWRDTPIDFNNFPPPPPARGLLDPTSNPAGFQNFITELDIAAFDVIGYDLRVAAVPEPGTWALIGFAAVGLAARRRRRGAETTAAA